MTVPMLRNFELEHDRGGYLIHVLHLYKLYKACREILFAVVLSFLFARLHGAG